MPDVVTKRAYDEGSAKRLSHEALALERCRGIAGVVELVAFDPERGELTTRRLAGRALDPDALRSLGPLERFEIALALVDTIDEIHARGVVHRDLKPTNIVLSPERARVTLIDFDHALVDGDGPAGGTRHFAAAELFYLPYPQLADYRADHFALALLLRGLLYDRPHMVEDTVRWQSLALEVSWPAHGEPLSAAIERHLAPWREDRPPTLDEVRWRLVEALGKAPAAAGPPHADVVSRHARADTRAWENVVHRLPEALRAAVAADVAGLSPRLHPRAPDQTLRLTEAELGTLVEGVARRRALITAGRPEHTFAITHLGLATGLLRETLAWARGQGGVAVTLVQALAANALGAHVEVERCLGAQPPVSGNSGFEATLHAVHAHSLAARGRAADALRHVRAAFVVGARGSTPEEGRRFWSAIAGTYLTLMDVAGLAALLEATSRQELSTAGQVVLAVADEHAAHLVAREARWSHRHPQHRRLFADVGRRGLVDLHHFVIEVALLHWPGAGPDREGVVGILERAAGVLARLAPDDAFGPLVRAAALARLGRFAEARELHRGAQANLAPLRSVLEGLAPDGADGDADWYALVAGWVLDLAPLKDPIVRAHGVASPLLRALDAIFPPELRRALATFEGVGAERAPALLEREAVANVVAAHEGILAELEASTAAEHLRMLDDLLEAMRLHGYPPGALRYQRMRLCAVRRDYGGVTCWRDGLALATSGSALASRGERIGRRSHTDRIRLSSGIATAPRARAHSRAAPARASRRCATSR